MTATEETDAPGQYEWEKPSRSARKRQAEALQRLGVRLTRLRPAQLAQIDLPEELRQAIQEAKGLSIGPAMARQNQYIGKLMRSIDPEPIERALARMQQ